MKNSHTSSNHEAVADTHWHKSSRSYRDPAQLIRRPLYSLDYMSAPNTSPIPVPSAVRKHSALCPMFPKSSEAIPKKWLWFNLGMEWEPVYCIMDDDDEPSDEAQFQQMSPLLQQQKGPTTTSFATICNAYTEHSLLNLRYCPHIDHNTSMAEAPPTLTLRTLLAGKLALQTNATPSHPSQKQPVGLKRHNSAPESPAVDTSQITHPVMKNR